MLVSYRWFDGFNWEGLRNRSLPPPILPKIQNHLDTSNFDEYPTDAEGPPPGSQLLFLFPHLVPPTQAPPMQRCHELDYFQPTVAWLQSYHPGFPAPRGCPLPFKSILLGGGLRPWSQSLDFLSLKRKFTQLLANQMALVRQEPIIIRQSLL